jgi:thiol-disulfide isomerase/thioredoxin
MRPRFPVSVLAAFACVFSSLAPVTATAVAEPVSVQRSAMTPVLKVVNFTAEWCPNCRIFDPNLHAALEGFDDGTVELVTIDITDAAAWDASTERAIEANIIPIYNGYVGITGLAVLVAADTGEKIECLNRTLDAEGIAMMIDRSRDRVGTTAPGNRAVRSVMCPPMREMPR